jgi:hypothetical protein
MREDELVFEAVSPAVDNAPGAVFEDNGDAAVVVVGDDESVSAA